MNIVTGFLANINEGKQYREVDKYIDLGKELLHATSHSLHQCKSTHYVILFLENAIRERVFVQSPTKQETWWYRGKSWNVYFYKIGMDVSNDNVPNKKDTFHVVIEFNKKDLFLEPYRPWITRFQLTTDNPNKDTLNYCLVQSQKMEWLRMAVVWQREKRNVDALQYPFVWMDFGVRHCYKDDSARFSYDLHHLYSSFDSCKEAEDSTMIQWKPYHHHFDDESSSSFEGPLGQQGMTLPVNRGAMHFGNCPRWGPEELPLFLNEGYDLYKRVGWLIAGGVFAGDADTVEMFAGIYYEKCLQIIAERQSIMWEVNVLAILYTEQPQWFSFYPADHNPSIIHNLFDSNVIHLHHSFESLDSVTRRLHNVSQSLQNITQHLQHVVVTKEIQ